MNKLTNLLSILSHQCRLWTPGLLVDNQDDYHLPVKLPSVPRGAWTLSSDALKVLVDEIASVRPRHILELGSGYSTLAMAATLRELGIEGKITSLDHKRKYLMQTRLLLERNALSSWVDWRLAPLERCRCIDYDGPWYSMDALTGLDPVDMVLIDGPPAILHPKIRYPTLEILRNKCKPGCRILVDDADRESERQMIARWMESSGVVLEHRNTAKGLAVLTIQP